jgi:predicted nuclease of predicted toxin-antitoxin system
VIFDRAAVERRILVSADADFGTLLAVRSSAQPSVIQFRGEGSRKADALARTLVANLRQRRESLENGCSVTFEQSRIRVRVLPIASRGDDE